MALFIRKRKPPRESLAESMVVRLFTFSAGVAVAPECGPSPDTGATARKS